MTEVRRCGFCRRELPPGSSSRRRYCSDDCRRGRTRPAADRELGAVEAALEASVAQATELGRITKDDAAAIAAARVLARRIDEDADRWEYALAWSREQAEGKGARPKPPPIDNVSLPTFLNYCAALGLTPAARKAATPADNGKGGGGGRKLDRHLGAVPRPAAG